MSLFHFRGLAVVGQDGILPPIEIGLLLRSLTGQADFQSAAGYQPALQF
jgi:hypothetical protein